VRGPSGCGKTTLLLTLGGMLCPTSGRVQLEERDLYALSIPERTHVRRAAIGFVFQTFHLAPYLDVLENVLLAAGKSSRETRQRAQALLDQLRLANRAHHKPAQLSAGEKQRAGLARALLNKPRLILADEPTGNLDPDNAVQVFRHLREFQRAGGTVIVVTHGLPAGECANRILDMRAGRIEARSPA
jgi:ABC-type lipoprotein export system ATPase subunit